MSNEIENKIFKEVTDKFAYIKDGQKVVDQIVCSAVIDTLHAVKISDGLSDMPIWSKGTPQCDGLYLVLFKYENRYVGRYKSPYAVLRFEEGHWYEKDYESVSHIAYWILLEKGNDNANVYSNS